jgi:hypothetical protein
MKERKPALLGTLAELLSNRGYFLTVDPHGPLVVMPVSSPRKV